MSGLGADAGRRLTASVGYQAAGLNLAGRRVRESYHAVADQAVPVSEWQTRYRGEALCGAAPIAACPPGLFSPVASCPSCIAIAARASVRIAGQR